MRFWLAVYRLFLRLYPRILRLRYGAELESCFAEQYAAERARGGVRGASVFALRALVDAPVSAWRMHGTNRSAPGGARGKGIGMVERLWLDLRQALRGLARSPWLTLLAVLSLSLGVGANATMLGMVNGVVWQRLPVPSPDRMVRVFERMQGEARSVSYPNFEGVRDAASDVFAGAFVHTLEGFSLQSGDGAEVVYGEVVSADYFDVLGIEPEMGRWFTRAESGEPGGAELVVLSHHLWATRFASDPGVVGREVRLNDHPFTVVGVAPASFNGTKFGLGMDLWVPIRVWGRLAAWGMFDDRGSAWLNVVARLRDGVTLAQARARLAAVAAGINAEEAREQPVDFAVFPESESSASPHAGGLMKVVGWLAIGASLLVLLVACGNVASLLLARSIARRREVGVRVAIGIGRGALAWQLLLESLLLALAGGVLGVGAAFVTSRSLLTYLPALPYRFAIDLAPDARVVVIAAVTALASAVLFGLFPVLDAARTDPVTAIKGGRLAGRRPAALRGMGAIVVAMVAFSCVSLVLTGLFVRSMGEARKADPGFAVEGRLYAMLDGSLTGDAAFDARAFYRELVARLESMPDVRSAAVASVIPLADHSNNSIVYAADHAYAAGESGLDTWRSAVTPDYFDAMGTTIVRGGGFGPEPRADGVRVALVNEVLADALWPGEDPIGKRIRFSREPTGAGIEVIGVVKAGPYETVGERPRAAMYRPFVQEPHTRSDIVVRTAGDPAAFAARLREAVAAVDPRVPVGRLITSDQHLRSAMWMYRFGAGVGTSLGLLALLLSAAGLYGVMAYSTGRSVRDVGIRMALGARAADVLRGVLFRGLRLAGLGVLLGLLAAAALGSTLSGLLFGVRARDPVTLGAVALTLVVIGCVASLFPAVAASRADPVRVLKEEG
ncbi:MAG: ADOP family duplicated permease [Gemmatimonadota bacterium]|jgi:predicted permease